MAAGETGPLRRLAPVLAVAGALAALALFFAVLPTPASREGGTAADLRQPDLGRPDLLQPPSGTFAVTGARVFDGEEVLPRADVLVEEGRIAAVGPDLEIPAGVPRVDGTGHTLLPGLVDAHVHAFGDALEHSLRFGVTTVLDMFTDPGWAAGVQERQARDGNPGEADLFSAGYLATAPGGHGTQFGTAVPTVDEDTDPDAWVAARLEEGSDWVKIVVEGGHGHGADLPTLSPERVEDLVRAAHRHGVLAVAHVGTAAEARTALAAGADGLVHLVVDRPLDDELVRLAADGGVFVVPTLTVLESVTGGRGGAALAEDPRLAGRLTRKQAAGLGRTFPAAGGGDLAHALESTRRLAAAGVPLLAGSDAPNPGTAHGASLHRELELLVEAGLSPVEALAAATSVPADAFGLPDRGRVAPGRRADLVLVEGDPTRDVTATRALRAVWKAGRPAELASPAPAAGEPGGAAGPPRVEPGPVSDFESGPDPSARIGSRRWFPSTDERMGGASTVSLAVEDGALRLRGEVVQAFAYPWAGAFLATSPELPGEAGEMAPADLSAATGLAFRARTGTAGGDADGATTLRLYLFSRELGPVPAVHVLPVSADWRYHRVPFSALGVDGSAVSGILLGAAADPGPFELWIDDVELYADGAPVDGRLPASP